ncbi:carbon-monoxide dehydrogenase small subunit [Scopulibacillus daqui]|uniref:Carbon-monoxide dehydrogenase small subunit n=2 Tax=Scopulibacillus daqui TaxID=1469162 RepID=A0ABS2PWY8_9BACL|nr:carbon-monoxide dehydrogenase small subunit [Scopulibacillus daqui]
MSMKYNRIPVTLKVNRQTKNADIRTADTLLDVLRENFGLTGSKPGCLNGDCGSCTVLIDGCPMKSCIMLGLEAAGREIVTVEGLRGSPVQRAFIENNAFQCGYCTPGFIMNIEGLIRKHPDADDAVIEEWLQSNICRCTSYQEIKAAVYAVLGKETREDHK